MVIYMKKIMFVANSLVGGGAEKVVSILSSKLLERGFEIYVLVHNKTKNSYAMNDNVKVIYSESKGIGAMKKVSRILSIRKALKKYSIDCLIAFSHYNVMYSVLASIGLNTKIIGSERNDPAQIKNRYFLNNLREILYCHLNTLVCQTNDAKNYFPEAIQKKSVIILNPLSEKLIASYHGERDKRIVTYCRLESQKNLPMLIKAFSFLHVDYPDYILEIYGEGDEKTFLLQMIKNLELEDYVFINPFALDIHEKVKKAAMFVLSSDYEGLSNSMLESMAIGLPVVVTDCPCGGARMVIEDGKNGILSPVGDADKFYHNMKRILDDRVLSESLSKNAVEIRQELSSDKIANQWLKVICG